MKTTTPTTAEQIETTTSAFFAGLQCPYGAMPDHSACIPRSSLPRLPDGWTIASCLAYPGMSDKVVAHCDSLYSIFAGKPMTAGEYQFLLSLFSVAYPQPETDHH